MIESISIEEILNNAKENGIEKVIVPSANPEDFPEIVELINKYDNVYGMPV